MVKLRGVSLLTVLAAFIVIAAAMLSVGTADAAKHAKPGGGRTTATLRVYQDGVQVTSIPVGTAFELRGSGFAPNSTVYVGTSGYFDLVPVTTDGGGCFSVARPGSRSEFLHLHACIPARTG
jgi:hypothetical protein